MTARKRTRPATTPEGRENQLISLAMDTAEKQMREGTAAAQVVTHYLKLGSSREKLEQARLQNENLLLSAKIDALASAKHVEVLIDEALIAMRKYKGDVHEEQEDYDYD